MKHTLTTDQILDLSGWISNRVTELTGLPITESEDAHLAITIARWCGQTGITVVDEESSEPLLDANPSPSDPSGGSAPHPEKKTPSTGHSVNSGGIL